MHYDYLVVGAGLTGALFAREATRIGKTCLIIERRNHIAGNVYTKDVEGIQVHVYGAHIFHTSHRGVWRYMNQFAEFNNYINSPIARYRDELYNLPFNMNTFAQMWNVKTPAEAHAKIEEQKQLGAVENPKNLEEQAINLIGKDIFTKLIEGYTEKQWGKSCKELPASIIKRLPVRFTFDNNYFNDRFQGIPIGGYTALVKNMIGDVPVLLNTEYKDFIQEHPHCADKTIYCGPIDEFFNFDLGPLEYRSLRFEHELLDCENYQGNAVVNYTERDIEYTRIIEHKHFEFGKQEKSLITREYPADWNVGDEPYYPINDEKNMALYEQYKKKAEELGTVIFAGRLGGYRYYDMDKAVAAAFHLVKEELGVDLTLEFGQARD